MDESKFIQYVINILESVNRFTKHGSNVNFLLILLLLRVESHNSGSNLLNTETQNLRSKVLITVTYPTSVKRTHSSTYSRFICSYTENNI